MKYILQSKMDLFLKTNAADDIINAAEMMHKTRSQVVTRDKAICERLCVSQWFGMHVC